MTVVFQKATRTQAKLRLALIAPAGGGKTWTALTVAKGLSDNVAVIDTEHGSASKYADTFDFAVVELTSFDPRNYIEAIAAAASAGFEVLVIDSLSHAWAGKDGALEQVDRAAASNQGNKFAAWRNVTPLHNQLVEAMVSYPGHIIVTMRSKTEYTMEEYEDRGRKKTRPVKVGLAPIQREGVDFEFDIVGELNTENTLVVTKTRCSALAGAVFNRPGEEFIRPLREWLTTGSQAPAPAPSPEPAGGAIPPSQEPSTPPAGPPVSESEKEMVGLRSSWWGLASSMGFTPDDMSAYRTAKYPLYESTKDMSADELEAEIAFFSALDDLGVKKVKDELTAGTFGKTETFSEDPVSELTDEDRKRYRRRLYAIAKEAGHNADQVKKELNVASTNDLTRQGWEAAIAHYTDMTQPPPPTER